MKSIDEYLEEGCLKWQDKPYIWQKHGGVFEPFTYGETVSRVHELAAALRYLGLSGSGVIDAENSFPWMVIDLCLMGYTGVSVPIDPEWTLFDVKNCLDSLSVTLFFYSLGKSELAKALERDYPEIRFVCIEEEFGPLCRLGREVLRREVPARNAPAAGSQNTGERNLEKTVKILFTSGTTAFPKAIPLSQKNMFANWATLYQRTPMTEADKSCLFLPLNHVYSGVANFLYSIISGMELFLCTNRRDLAADLLEIRPTVICTVPVLLDQLLPDVGRKEERIVMLRHIRFLYCGGSPVALEKKRSYRALGIKLIEAYGTTETSSVIALEKPGDSNLESNGVVFENLTVRIDQPDASGVGEICVRGDSRTRGYLNVPDQAPYFDADGFYHTGDLGRLDEERHLYIKGRKRRTLDKGNGKNVYADELEELLLAVPEVRKASVYLSNGAITAAIWAEREDCNLRAALDAVNEKLPHFKQIAEFRINDTFMGSWFKE